jgi:hypothetical protein
MFLHFNQKNTTSIYCRCQFKIFGGSSTNSFIPQTYLARAIDYFPNISGYIS